MEISNLGPESYVRGMSSLGTHLVWVLKIEVSSFQGVLIRGVPLLKQTMLESIQFYTTCVHAHYPHSYIYTVHTLTHIYKTQCVAFFKAENN